ncbi:zinc-binding dehydrogenase [Ramlibacter tataouinensis]|uniref:2,3-butanediol dehydrogenase-like protein n=1 Tax=Ramlibacter tataouinensis (strain ATCC BAA-407 / DSM 14655 / LMG 21543 / TTB310) TaxID=365046 RepID=F5Y0S9_RAMTT|nr:zinc-binding dehydrogenase [Ramlibacter tataouinensis]AEG94673.1 2,3-butanediol dehydrogenase-like protein [Ramlibacter tataouinensis TTB310]
MKAVVSQHARLSVVDLSEPVPGEGQLVLDVTRCGICGSDLHARHDADAQADVLAQAGYGGFARSHEKVVYGHEFCGTVVEHGPGTSRKLRTGASVVALPLVRMADGMHAIGLSASAPGAYAERVLVEEAFTIPVPNGLAPEVAVLTEPMAIGLHAVRRSEITRKDAAVVIGCGPVGLAIICLLRAFGVETIVASDYSPGRRALAQACGAAVTVDPAAGSPYESLAGRGYMNSISDQAAEGLTGMMALRALPVPWHVALRVLDKVGARAPKRPIVFECVGVPGVIDDIISKVPLSTRIVVAGVCMKPDQFRPVMAINKEIELRFVMGYDPLEFRDTLRMLAEGRIDASPLVTGVIGLEGVSGAFDLLGSPDAHAKVIIDPRSSATL